MDLIFFISNLRGKGNPSMANKYRFADPRIRKLGYLVWLILAVLAVLFYQERSLFTDAAWQNFKMLQEGEVYISQNRLGNVIPQFLPLLVMKLGASVKAILIAYSLSLLLFYAGVYALLVERLKNEYLGWALILYLTLLSFDSFYHIQSEVYQGTAVLLLLFGVVLRYPALNNYRQWGILVCLMILLVFYHKLLIVFFAFLWAYLWLWNKDLRHRKYFLLLPLMFLLFWLQGLGWDTAYEDNRMGILRQSLVDYFPNFWDIPANLKFLEKCKTIYYFFPIILLDLTIWYIWKREGLKLGLVWLACIGYILLVHYSSPHTSYRFYAEVTYLSLGLVVGLPLIFDPLVKWQNGKYTVWILMLIVGARLVPMIQNHNTFENRLEWISGTLDDGQDQHGGQYFRMYSGLVEKDLIVTDWAVPY